MGSENRIKKLIDAIDEYASVLVKGDEHEKGQALGAFTRTLEECLPAVLSVYDEPGFNGDESERDYWPAQVTRILGAIEAGDAFLTYDSLVNEMRENLLRLELTDPEDAPESGSLENSGPGSSFFDINLSSIRSARPDLFELLTGITDNGDGAAGSENVAGREVLFCIKEGSPFLLDSMYSSVTFLDLWERETGLHYDSKVVMFGLGNGMYAGRILSLLGNAGLLIVYEPDIRLFRYVIERFDLSRILSDSRLILIFPETEDIRNGAENDLYYIMGARVEYTDLDGLRIVTYMNYDRLYPDRWTYFDEKTAEVVSSMRANRSVLSRYGQAFVRNDLTNYPFLAASFDMQSLQAPDGLCGIIVSSGPSLNKNIQELKKAKGRALIAAADSAVSVLLSEGIVPDIFFCVDAKKNAGHFKDERIKDIPLCTDLDATRIVFEGRRSPCFFGRVRNPHVSAFLDAHGIELPLLKSGGSVAHTAAGFLTLIGVRTIVLVGQDLAYTGDRSHAAGSLRSGWNIDLSKNECYVEANGGGEVRSTHEFVTYRNWFERQIASDTLVRYINATEGGARIHGAEEMTLAKAIEECCVTDFDAAAFLGSAEPIMSDDVRAAFSTYMDGLKPEIERLSEEIRGGLRIYDELTDLVLDGKYGNQRFKKLYSRTREIGIMLEESDAMYYVECMVQKEMTEVMDRAGTGGGDMRSELLSGLGNGRDYFEIINRGCGLVLAYLNEK